MFIVEWNDFEGNQHQREFDTLEDAQLEAAYLETKYGERIAPQETLLKIAKALGVHLRDLADNSWLEEFEQQHPDANERANAVLQILRP